MIATRPSVCMVVCMARRSSAGISRPSASRRGTASTVIASATTSWIMKPTGESRTASTNQLVTGMTAFIAAGSASRPIMMPMLAAISPAPRNTSASFQRQTRSTMCPATILMV